MCLVCVYTCGGQRSMCMYDMCVVCVCIHMCGAHRRMCMHGYVYGIHIYTCGGQREMLGPALFP